MTFELIIFYLFSAIMVAAALRMITARNPVHSILSLVLVFFTASAIWLLLEAEFLAITLVLVYVGAVMVLFLFVVMMLNINIAKLREGFVKFMPLAIVISLIMIAELVLVMLTKDLRIEPVSGFASEQGNTHALGEILYTQYLLPFETAAVILLVAIIAAIVLTLRTRLTTQSQNPAEQVKVKAKDRIRIVSLASEDRERY